MRFRNIQKKLKNNYNLPCALWNEAECKCQSAKWLVLLGSKRPGYCPKKKCVSIFIFKIVFWFMNYDFAGVQTGTAKRFDLSLVWLLTSIHANFNSINEIIKSLLKPGQNKKGQKTVLLEIFLPLLILWRL